MSIVPEQRRFHPMWCARKHPPDSPVHDRPVGVDLELNGGIAYSVGLQLVDLEDAFAPTEVLFTTRTPGEASVTRLTLLEAGILRDLLSEALALVGQR